MNHRQRYAAKMKIGEHEQAYATGRGHSLAIRTHQEAADILGISRQAVHQLERNAFYKIRLALVKELQELNPKLAAKISSI